MVRPGLNAALLVVAVVSLGLALQEGNGALWADAIFWLTISVVASLAAWVLPSRVFSRSWFELVVQALAVAGVAVFISELLTTPPGIYLRLRGPEGYAPFFHLVAVGAVLAAIAIAGSRGWRLLSAVGLVIVFALTAAWVLERSPSPRIDVFMFQQQSMEALLEGRSPYAMTYPDPYSPAESARFYGPGVSTGGRLQFGFPYFPLSLLMVIPAKLVAGDFRYAQVAMVCLTAILLLTISRRAALATLAISLLLLTPRSFFVLEQSWTEPLVLGLFALTLFTAVRAPRWIWLPLGLFVASKQYAFIVAPLVLLVAPRPLTVRAFARLVGLSVLTLVVVTVPFVVWSPEGFVRSVVTLQLHQPFRTDALSYLAWFHAETGSTLSPVLAFVAAAIVLGVSLWRAPRTPFGFALSCAVCLFAFVSLNKQAFANYYFLIHGVLCCSLAAVGVPPPRTASVDGEVVDVKV